MKFPKTVPVQEIAEKINATLIGKKDNQAKGINEIHHVEEGDITFVDVKKYFNKSLKSAATIIILNEKVSAPKGKTLLLCDDPFSAYNTIVQTYRPFRPLRTAIDASAKIDPSSVIEPNAVIGPEVVIGKNCHIQANVTIAEHTIIGDDVTIQSGAIIGTEAFYYKRSPEGFTKWRSGGRVIIQDGVDVGPGCTINKGVSSDTIIGAGTKMDAQVHIGHDVVVGERCLLAGQVGIGGNTTVGNDVIMYGQVGVAQNLNIENGVVILAKSGVSKNLKAGKTYFGYPAAEARMAYKELAALRHLPEFLSDYYK
ncbi:MAG TPA: LpxD N-terminal domain-containing protein [Saprospiraceae bacterium]|nr:LpxD N-terminal domain-containing protein [Saprospiraceae bacterium]